MKYMGSVMPKFKIYFLKEETREYPKSDLITFITSNPNVTQTLGNDTNQRIYTYHHSVLNFEANFIMSNKAVIPHIQDIPAKYYDVNFYVEFDVILSNYAVEILLDIIEEICRKFKFYVFVIKEVMPFKRQIMMKLFESVKRAHIDNNPDIVLGYNKLDPQAFSQVYSYLQKRKRLELTLDTDKIVITNYMFLHTEKSRAAYITIKWDGESQFILPPAVEILLLDDGKVERYIPMSEVLDKADKFFTPIDGYGDIQLLDKKYVKKLHKILVKEKFAPLNVRLDTLSLDKILDV